MWSCMTTVMPGANPVKIRKNPERQPGRSNGKLRRCPRYPEVGMLGCDALCGRLWSDPGPQGHGIVVLCPIRSWRAESQGCQGLGGVPCVVAAGRGIAGVPGHFQDPDTEVAQGSHDLRSADRADLRGVLAVADVPDVVQHLDLPVAAYPFSELGRGSLAGVQAGDRVDGDGAPFLLAVQGPGEADGLGGVREGDPGRDGRDLQGAVLLAAVPTPVLRAVSRDATPGQVLDLGIQAGLVLLHRQADPKAAQGQG